MSPGITVTRKESQSLLRQIWAEVLDVEVKDINIHDNFFLLGGDSLSLSMALNRINDAFSIALTLGELFKAPGFQQMCNLVNDCQAMQSSREPVTRVGRQRRLQATPAQQGLWFLHEYYGGAVTAYNAPVALRLTGSLDIPALQDALNTIINRHEILRTTFKREVNETGIVQIINRAQTLALNVIEVTEAQAPDLISAHNRHQFDLSAGPLILIDLLKFNEQSHILLINVHHIVADGWSAGIFIRELAALYTAYSGGEPEPLSPLPIQYAHYSYWLQQCQHGEAFQARLRYWRKQLAGIPALLALPADRPRPLEQSFAGSSRAFTIPGPLPGKLKALAHQQEVTLFMLLLAVFKVLLWRYSNQEDIVVGTPVANRRRPELENLIGLFVNILVLRDSINANMTFVELLKQVKQNTLAAFENQEIPFEQLVRAMNPVRSPGHTPLFQVMFILQNSFSRIITLPGLEVDWLEQTSGFSKFDLTMELYETADGLAGRIEYSSDLYDAATISRMIHHYEMLLHAIVEDPGRYISDYSLVTDEECELYINHWRGDKDARSGVVRI